MCNTGDLTIGTCWYCNTISEIVQGVINMRCVRPALAWSEAADELLWISCFGVALSSLMAALADGTVEMCDIDEKTRTTIA